jgi:uncharacterized protein with GYD domain
MFQAAYTAEAWKVQIDNPQNRIEQVRPMIESQGGKILGAYYAFGEYDLVIILEAPDNVSVSALALAAAAGGAVKAQKTTVLMSVEEGIEAMRRASRTGDQPPGGSRTEVFPKKRYPAVLNCHRVASVENGPLFGGGS